MNRARRAPEPVGGVVCPPLPAQWYGESSNRCQSRPIRPTGGIPGAIPVDLPGAKAGARQPSPVYTP